MARDDWRLRIELPEVGGLLDRLRAGLSTEADDLARELEQQRLAVTHDEDTVFVYAASLRQAEQAQAVVEAELAELGLQSVAAVAVEHWLADEERWDDEPPGVDDDDEVLARGYAPWEVRVTCRTAAEARELADRLEAEGYGVVRRWRYVLAGAASREEADALAQRVQGEVEPGGELVWEVTPRNPFALFLGGLGG
jgi:hypothetical protein